MTFSPSRKTSARTEFPPGAVDPPAGMSRRRFLEIMGASLAMTSLGGCFRSPKETIHPYLERPTELLAHQPLRYATTLNWRGYGRGLLATSYEGRPIKLDGNSAHPTGGASDAVTQAAVLNLYDQARLRTPRREGQSLGWQPFDTEVRERREQAPNGEGWWFLAEANTSPSEQARWQQLARAFPRARFVFERPAAHLHYPPFDYHFEKADVVVGIGPDFLTEHPSSLRWAREFARRRRTTGSSGEGLNRFHSLHAVPNVTTTMADSSHRAPVDTWESILQAIEDAVNNDFGPLDKLEEKARSWARKVAEDLRAHRGRCLVLAGATEDPALHEWARRLNEKLENIGKTATPLTPPAMTASLLPPSTVATIEALAEALDAGEVANLVVLDANPVFTRPDVFTPESFARAHWSAVASDGFHETSELGKWALPLHHFLEDWGDLRAFDGTASPIQPLIRPIFDSRSRLEFLDRLAFPTRQRGAFAIVQDFWRERIQERNFEKIWQDSLEKGVFPPVERREKNAENDAAAKTSSEPHAAPPDSPDGDEFTLALRLDPALEDGRFARNPWLQEFPRPLSQIVWDSCLWIHPEDASARGWSQDDVVEVSTAHGQARLPLFPQPLVARGTIVAFLGFGRTTAQLHANQDSGYDAFALWDSKRPWNPGSATLRPTGETYPLVSLQKHREMEGHEFVRVREPGKPAPKESPPKPEETSFYPDPPSLEGDASPYQWGMSIDLSACFGCAACVTACIAENNIPIVGKEQIARGREMHWLRVDHYLEHSAAHQHPILLHQPRPCMHCEKAPCEVVCPVAATVHDREGLNSMIYNRCVGTRYCSNNCPYKVRCFNFLDYRPPKEARRRLQFNPEVTVRERGVMEKCTYCVQRISHARIEAKKRDDTIPPNSLTTACQDACPAEAIVFGNIADEAWEVTERKREQSDYALLGELDTRPRTTYLPKWRNPPA